MIVYKAENKVSRKVYIGITTRDVNKRIVEHLVSNTYFGNALRKYGLQSFTISVIDSANDWKTLCGKEKYWIAFYDCRTPKGYNITTGGEGVSGYVFTEEMRKHLSEMNTGKKHSEETKQKMRQPRSEEFKEKHRLPRGPHTEEALQKMRKPKYSGFGKVLSKAKKGKPLSEKNRLRLKVPHGPMSDINKQKISQALVLKYKKSPLSEEVKTKRLVALRKWWEKEDAKSMRRTAPPKCACGCGLPVSKSKAFVKKWNKYINGHVGNINGTA
jgi:group I intron endonuclease